MAYFFQIIISVESNLLVNYLVERGKRERREYLDEDFVLGRLLFFFRKRTELFSLNIGFF